ncbi:probable F420-dependent oxidoreductase, Rv2161c family [Pseudonocardia oroxyli]|uniref:Probable F420-dependent oxidoreductase, Rv2161c family n=1 Tax=Pseudonocardia oroxyli TaxID=366584 RepID=A0A1G8A0A9_PSEOR|nr:probable F420-dependent oxidoreductase, Rv2161c family [Pseudonocardia oroxyli]
MRIGVTLPQFGDQAEEVGEIARFAREAEALGAASLWTGDRLLAAVEPRVNYPGLDHVPAEFRRSLDPVVLLAAAAAATTTARLGTSTLNAPWYPPAILARTALSLDRLSGGRLVLGLGLGWSPEEAEAVGSPMAERGARLDEFLDVLDVWTTGDPVSFVGKHTEIAPAHVDLKPHGIGVYLGGWAPRSFARIAARGAGWLPAMVPGQPLDGLVGLWDSLGRPPAFLRVNAVAGMSVELIRDALGSAAEAGFTDAFVELMYLCRGVDGGIDEALALTAEFVG